MNVNLDVLDALWVKTWPTQVPWAPHVRSFDAERWVRFHSLPESQRYARNEDEHVEIQQRHYALLRDLQETTNTEGSELLIINASLAVNPIARPFSTPTSAVQIADDLPWQYWTTFKVTHTAAEDVHWTYATVATCEMSDPGLRHILRLVAEDVVIGQVIADPGLRWLYAPYDGGGDVLAPSRETRDALRNRHSAWLSVHPSGM